MLPPQFGFAIEYTDSVASLRYYQPDFAVVLADDTRQLVETKGREDPDVPFKDRAARTWCENATALTGATWQYGKVPQAGFESLQPDAYSDLLVSRRNREAPRLVRRHRTSRRAPSSANRKKITLASGDFIV